MSDSPSPAGLPPSPHGGGSAPAPFDYSGVLPAEAPAAPTLASLSALVDEAITAQALVDAAEAALKERSQALARIVEVRLPEAMALAGMQSFTAHGLRVSIEDVLQVKQPPVSQREAAYDWLNRHEQGGLIKRTVEIAFGAGEQEAERAHALVDRLGVDFPSSVREQQEVNTASLKAFLRRELEDGKSPPLDIFGARRMRVAKFEKK